MGEFAGYALDETMGAENDRWLYRQGQMSDLVAFDLGIIDHHGRYQHVPLFPRAARSTTKTCRHCAMAGLAWKRTPAGGWRLHAGDEVHACDAYQATNRVNR